MSNFQNMSVQELNKQSLVTMDSKTGIRLYYRSTDLLLRQARVYDSEKSYARAYVLYMKYISLATEHLPKHPEYVPKSPDAMQLKKGCFEALAAAERLKPILTSQERQRAASAQSQPPMPSVLPQTIPASIMAPAQDLSTSEKHNSMPPATRYYSQSGLEPKLETYIPSDEKYDPGWSIQKELGSLYIVPKKPYESGMRRLSRGNGMEYPVLEARNQSDGLVYTPPSRTSAAPSAFPTSYDYSPPALPPKPRPMTSETVKPSSAALPQVHQEVTDSRPPTLPPKPDVLQAPVGGPETAAEAAAWLESGAPLRQIELPHGIHHRFLNIAARNTSANLETCGILSGVLKNNVLKVTYLIIPKQTATSDTVATTHEEELFEFQDKRDLMTLGWIHTHPRQSCFMSSVDLHTHCSYQIMLPESIAVVCAPSQDPNVGIFRLTDPPGLQTIINCTEKPAFHPHPDVPIYRDADVGGGHVRMVDHGFDVADLR